eukprot:g8010.t1
MRIDFWINLRVFKKILKTLLKTIRFAGIASSAGLHTGHRNEKEKGREAKARDGAQARNCPPLCNFGCGTSLGLCGCSDVVQRLYHPFVRGIQGNAEEGLQVSFVVRERGQLRQPPPIDDRAVAANKIMDVLGFESGRLYSEGSYIVELAKWGFAAITRIRQATQDLSELTPSSVPHTSPPCLGKSKKHLSLIRGSSFDNTPIRFDPTPELLGMDTAGIEYYLSEKHPSCDRRIKNGTLYLVYITMSKVYDDCVSRYFDFILPETARKLISGETIQFAPKCKRRRGQEQLRLAFQSGDGEVWECKTCDPPSYHVVNTEHKGKKHTCRSRVGGARVSFPPSRNNCSCVPLFCSCAHRTPVYNPVKQMQLRVPELRQWWLASFLERLQNSCILFAQFLTCRSFIALKPQQLREKLKVAFFRDENKQNFVFLDNSNLRPKPAWMHSPAAMACILSPAALPQWLNLPPPRPAAHAASTTLSSAVRSSAARGRPRGQGRRRQRRN